MSYTFLGFMTHWASDIQICAYCKWGGISFYLFLFILSSFLIPSSAHKSIKGNVMTYHMWNGMNVSIKYISIQWLNRRIANIMPIFLLIRLSKIWLPQKSFLWLIFPFDKSAFVIVLKESLLDHVLIIVGSTD